jgi:hypothetical protein
VRDDVGRFFTELVEIASFAKDNINVYLDFYKDPRSVTLPNQNDDDDDDDDDDQIAFLTGLISRWIVDGDAHQDLAHKLGRSDIPTPHFYFRQHPWLCGLVQSGLPTLRCV